MKIRCRRLSFGREPK